MDADAIAAAVACRPLSVALAHRVQVGADLRMAWDVHPGLEMVWHRCGQGAVSFGDGSRHPFCAGSIEIYAPGLPHRLHPDRPTDEYFLRVAAIPAFATLRGTSLMLPEAPDAVVAREFETVTAPLAAGRLAQAERDHRATALFLRLLPHAIPRQAELPPSAAQRHAAAARHYIRTHAATLTAIEEVAQALGVSHSHLRHVVTQVHGHSLVREWMEARILLAEEQLRTTSDTLAVVARRCGFASENYFCRVYRALRGQAPGALRAGARMGREQPKSDRIRH